MKAMRLDNARALLRASYSAGPVGLLPCGVGDSKHEPGSVSARLATTV